MKKKKDNIYFLEEFPLTFRANPLVFEKLYQQKLDRKMKKVIDGDSMYLVGYFYLKDTESVLQFLKKLGKWEDVDTDTDGDIILYKNID